MNFLAHIYLSEEKPELTIGNFIADAIKGKQYLQYPIGIQKGILLHRKIDRYTDTHPMVKKSVSRLFPTYSHYSAVIIDIFYDHFLASNWNTYSKTLLEEYINSFYELLKKNHDILPEKIQRFLPYMLKDNWLLSYASISGISKILYQMNHRTKNKSKMNFAVIELEKHYTLFNNEFSSFFEDIIIYTKNEIRKI